MRAFVPTIHSISRRARASLVVGVACALVIGACGGDATDDATTTTTTAATTTVGSADVVIPVELAAVFAEDGGGCAGTGEFAYLDEGAVVTLDAGAGTFSGSLGPGIVATNEYGLEVCAFEARVAGVPLDIGAYTYALEADSRNVTGTGSGAAPGPLLYPHGVANGRGYELVEWELYPEGMAVWYTDVFQSNLLLDGVIGREDFVFGVGFAPETGAVFTNPFEGGSLSWHVIHGPYASWYTSPEEGFQVREAVIGTAPHQWAQQGDPAADDIGIWMLTTNGNVDIDYAAEGFDVFDLDRGETFGVAAGHDQLQIVSPGIEVVFAMSHGGPDGYEYSVGPDDYVLFDFFPYLEAVLDDPPQSDWAQGISVVVDEDCASCDEVLAMLETAPEGLPVETLSLDDRIARMYALSDVPYVAARGPGQFDKDSVEGDDVLGEMPGLIEKVCGWLDTCG